MRTYYELLNVPIDADADTIKKAFRREIARYHPDKVVHLGNEFQDLAASRAAELTVAYKTLTDPEQRSEYDAMPEDRGRGPGMAVAQPVPAPPAPPVETPSTPSEPRETERQSSGSRFESERAGRDMILRRAMTARVQGIVEGLYGHVATPSVRGFDLAMVPVAKPRFVGAPPPRVLMKVIERADGPAVHEAGSNAARAGVHSGKSPVAVLLFAKALGPSAEVRRAIASLERRPRAEGPFELAVIVVKIADLTAHLPEGASPAIRKLVDALRA